MIGEQAWTDYILSADVTIAGGDVELGGHFKDQNKLSYRWILDPKGNWKLNFQAKTLASGSIAGFDGAAWHAMKLVFRGGNVEGHIDGHRLAQAKAGAVKSGMAILASTYDGNLFDNISIR